MKTPQEEASVLAMKPALQRIAIAEVCGWRQAKSKFADKSWIRPDGYRGGIGVNAIPDYLNDLNAMHEVTLSVIHTDPHVRRLYYQTLDMVTGDQWNTVDATAAQRAEAFLRTMGRWVE